METLKARVKNGRLILDEPTELPEGATLELVPTADSDDLDASEQAALHASLERALAEHRAGAPTISGEELLEELRRGR